MINWKFNEKNYNQEGYDLINEGNHRVRIMEVKETMAKNGTEGLEITLEVSRYENRLKYFIWYNRESAIMTDQKLGELFESFNITGDDRNNCESWIGKMGAVHVVHDEYRGHMIAKVKFCLKRDVQVKLPAWKESDSLSVDSRAWMGDNSVRGNARSFNASNGLQNVGAPMRSLDGFNMKF